MRYHFTSVKVTEVGKADNHKCWWECGEVRILYIPVLVLGVYLREMKIYARAKAHTQLFRTARQHCNQKAETAQVSITWWKANKNVAEQTMGYYSTTWRNEVLIHTTTRMKTRLHERTWSQRVMQRVTPLIWNLRIDSSLETKGQLVLV